LFFDFRIFRFSDNWNLKYWIFSGTQVIEIEIIFEIFYELLQRNHIQFKETYVTYMVKFLFQVLSFRLIFGFSDFLIIGIWNLNIGIFYLTTRNTKKALSSLSYMIFGYWNLEFKILEIFL